MSDQITLTLENRNVVGKAVRQLRRDGIVPAVIHDHGKDSIHVQGVYLDMYKAYQNAGKHHPVHLTVDGKKYLALIRDATFEPRKNNLRHVVFNAIKQNETVSAEVPLILSEEIPAERAGLIVLRHVETVEVEGLPKDLVDTLTVEASGLEAVGDKLTVGDIKVPKGITIMADPEVTVATVEMPRDQIAEANAAAAETAAQDGKTEAESAEQPASGEQSEAAATKEG